jgi:hypothetical protein
VNEFYDNKWDNEGSDPMMDGVGGGKEGTMRENMKKGGNTWKMKISDKGNGKQKGNE